MSLEITLKVISYDKETNTCRAIDSFGRDFDFDPFVSCAIKMTDEQYSDGFGFSIVGNRYVASAYSFSNGQLVPHVNGLVLFAWGAK